MAEEKVYLNTIEELSDALAAGKVVYDKFQQKTWKDKNGFLVTETKNGKRYFGKALWTEDGLYTLEPKPLEVKLWHLYENKAGDKVFIGGKCIYDVPYLFHGIRENAVCSSYYNKNGESSDSNNKYDLIKELTDLSQYFEK